MLRYDLGMNDLSLLLKLLIGGDFLETFAHINEFGMEFVDLTFFSEFKQMSLVVGVEIN